MATRKKKILEMRTGGTQRKKAIAKKKSITVKRNKKEPIDRNLFQELMFRMRGV